MLTKVGDINKNAFRVVDMYGNKLHVYEHGIAYIRKNEALGSGSVITLVTGKQLYLKDSYVDVIGVLHGFYGTTPKK